MTRNIYVIYVNGEAMYALYDYGRITNWINVFQRHRSNCPRLYKGNSYHVEVSTDAYNNESGDFVGTVKRETVASFTV